ncbi:MAG: hypothetical protein NTX50_18420 [Candidatus Sumerlaeota bacterium]|nr:hypothetical protein [Candidatus Sumerlaeota bacterium]
MEAIRKVIRIPANRRLVIELPKNIAVSQAAEVIVILPEKVNDRARKIKQMAACAKDKLFQDDLKEISEDFAAITQ